MGAYEAIIFYHYRGTVFKKSQWIKSVFKEQLYCSKYSITYSYLSMTFEFEILSASSCRLHGWVRVESGCVCAVGIVTLLHADHF